MAFLLASGQGHQSTTTSTQQRHGDATRRVARDFSNFEIGGKPVRWSGHFLSHTRDRSREANAPPRFACSPLHERGERSADRRSGAAAPVGGPVMVARRRQRTPCVASATLASRRSTAAVVGSGPPWRNLRAVHMSGALGLALVHSHVPLVVAEGRCRRTPPGGCCLHGQTRRTPHPVLLRRCLATSTLWRTGRQGL